MQVLRDVSISGDGEPTACPELLPVVSSVGEQLETFGLNEPRCCSISLPMRLFSTNHWCKAHWMRYGKVVVVYGRNSMLVHSLGSSV